MKDRVYYIDYLRIISCIAIVLLHVNLNLWNTSIVGSTNFNISAIFSLLVRFAVPIFFMLSGALFLSKKEIDIKRLYTKNILKLLIILVLWLPIHGIFFYTHNIGNVIDSMPKLYSAILYTMYNSNNYQFWFIITLLGIYVILPVLKKIADDEKLLKYVLILFFIFQILVFSLTVIIGTNNLFSKILILLSPETILLYPGYFLLGYYLYKTDLSKNKKWLSYTLGVLSILYGIIFTIVFSNMHRKYSLFIDNNSIITTYFMSIMVFNIFKYFFKDKKVSDKSSKIIIYLSDCTLGIFILHFLVKWTLESVINIYFTTPIITVPLFTIIITFISLILTSLIKKIPIIGKYII